MTAKFSKEAISVIVGEYAAVAAEDYDARTAVVKELADRYEVTENVIRGKLVAEGVYVKKEILNTSVQNKRVDKEAVSKAVEAFLGVKIKSVRNMTGKDLTAMWERLVELSDVKNAELGK